MAKTYWNKRKNKKRMSTKKLSEYRRWLLDKFPVCQICGFEMATEAHHAKYGRFGADKDDRCLVAICHDCHYSIHHGRDCMVSREEAIRIGEVNFEIYNNDSNMGMT